MAVSFVELSKDRRVHRAFHSGNKWCFLVEYLEMRKNKNKDVMDKIFSDPKFKGKHVIIVGSEIFMATTGKGANKILDKIHKKYPKETPAITYIPKVDTLILWL